MTQEFQIISQRKMLIAGMHCIEDEAARAEQSTTADDRHSAEVSLSHERARFLTQSPVGQSPEISTAVIRRAARMSESRGRARGQVKNS